MLGGADDFSGFLPIVEAVYADRFLRLLMILNVLFRLFFGDFDLIYLQEFFDCLLDQFFCVYFLLFLIFLNGFHLRLLLLQRDILIISGIWFFFTLFGVSFGVILGDWGCLG